MVTANQKTKAQRAAVLPDEAAKAEAERVAAEEAAKAEAERVAAEEAAKAEAERVAAEEAAKAEAERVAAEEAAKAEAERVAAEEAAKAEAERVFTAEETHSALLSSSPVGAGFSPIIRSYLGLQPAKGGVLVVSGPAKGRRRAGRAFGPTPERIPLAELSDDDIAAIAADPELASHREEGDA